MYPPRTPREVRRWPTVNAAAAMLSEVPKWARIRSLGTELFQLMFGQKADQAFGNGLRFGV
jgi:hypothetical protein